MFSCSFLSWRETLCSNTTLDAEIKLISFFFKRVVGSSGVGCGVQAPLKPQKNNREAAVGREKGKPKSFVVADTQMWLRADVCLANDALSLLFSAVASKYRCWGSRRLLGAAWRAAGQQLPHGRCSFGVYPKGFTLLRLISCIPSLILVLQRWFCRLLPLFFLQKNRGAACP